MSLLCDGLDISFFVCFSCNRSDTVSAGRTMIFVCLFIYFLYVWKYMLIAPNHNLQACLIVSAGYFSWCYPVRLGIFLKKRIHRGRQFALSCVSRALCYSTLHNWKMSLPKFTGDYLGIFSHQFNPVIEGSPVHVSASFSFLFDDQIKWWFV